MQATARTAGHSAHRGHNATALFAASFLSVMAYDGAASKAEAGEKVGVTAAVTPKATSKMPGSATKTLKIGKSVFYNERIVTSASGVVQVLLVDGSTFMVGPHSNLVIDKFVYNPAKGVGELSATLSKGALRFVGGKLSKREPGVKIKTPAGELTVRGGIAQGIVNNANQAVFAFVFGDYLALRRKGRRYTIRQSGNLFAIGNGGAPIIRRATAADTNLILAAISGRSGGTSVYKTKAGGWPFYYGIQPTGQYPDEPDIREQYYANQPLKLRRVRKPRVHKPHIVHTPPPTYREPQGPSTTTTAVYDNQLPNRPDTKPTTPTVILKKPTINTIRPGVTLTRPGFSVTRPGFTRR